MNPRRGPRSRYGFVPCLFLLSLAVPTLAWGQVAMRLAPAAVSGNPGEQVEVEVRISTSGLQISLVQFSVDFDATALRYESTRVGDDLLPLGFIINQETIDPIWPPATPGTNDNAVVQVYGGTSNFVTGEDLLAAVMTFTVQPGACETSPIGLDPICPHSELVLFRPVVAICAPDLLLSGTTFTRSSLQVTGCARYYGPNFIAPEWNPPIPGVQIELYDGTGNLIAQTSTGVDGCFVFTGVAEGSYTVVASREVQGEDRRAISGADAVLLFQATGGGLLLDPKQETAGDVAGALAEDPPGNLVTVPNGILDSSDPVAISKWLAFLRDGADAGWTAKWVFDVFGTGAPAYSFDLACPGGILPIPIEGYLLGDANVSWPPDPLKSPHSSPILFSLFEQRGDGNEVLVGLIADLNGETLESLLYTLEYGNNLRYLGMEAGERTQGFYAVDNPAETGILHGALLGGLVFAEKSGGVLTLRFERLDPEQSASISFNRLMANDLPAEANTLVLGGTTDQPGLQPNALKLLCAPNPFNPSTTISYGIPESGNQELTALRIYDLAGRLVHQLVQGQLGAGTYQIQWNGTDNTGRDVGTGVYFVKLHVGDQVAIQKVVLVK